MKRFVLALLWVVVSATGFAQAAGGDAFISRVKLWESYPDKPLEITCLTPLGNRADLAAFINLSFQYPAYCMEMWAEGRMFYEVQLTAAGTLDSLLLGRGIPGCPAVYFDAPIRANLLRLQKVDATGRTRKFTIETRVDVVPRLPILDRPLEIIPRTE